LQVSLPGDSLLFLAGIYNRFNWKYFIHRNDFINVFSLLSAKYQVF
jgi:hypothetical protein